MKYNEQIGQLTGIDGTEATYDAFCNEGAKAIINLMPPSVLETIKQVSSFTASQSVSGRRVLEVMRNDGTYDQPCRKVNASLRGRVLDSGDMNYALASDPVYYIHGETCFVKPAPDSSAGIMMYVGYPDIDASAKDVGGVEYFPDEYEHLIVMYASIKELQKQMYDIKAELPTHNKYDEDSPTSITTTENGWEAVRYYIETEEDIELSQAEMNALTAEMQQFMGRYQWLQGQQVKLQQEYEQGIQGMMARG
jgi:hypothetical protein|tara:strand:- start:1787 stop:2539 length:753 start_codon:yes stop_codon:yes gene_type:complete